MSDEAIRKRTKETANKLFGKGIQLNPPYLMWKEFDKDLANDFSKFITGNLYSRTVLTLPERQMAACAMLAAIRAGDELKLHVNAALNVGCDPKSPFLLWEKKMNFKSDKDFTQLIQNKGILINDL
ncbi:MAG: carboxymuconolactone decarboxylase family protein [Deltaproteobacteria bacterium]|nr:carboxymuconolactone decarboxylase family protein [Deltaproteobacteria bacterium]